MEADCQVTFVKAGGPGGQHRNKRETGVRLFHRPSGVVVTAVERRSQAMNLEEAFARLAARLTALNHVPKSRKKTRIPFSAQRKRLEGKRRQSLRKAMRNRPAEED